MTKEERNAAKEAGQRILRARYTGLLWQIYEYTDRGGWKLFNNTAWNTREEAQDTIEYMIKLIGDSIVHDK